MTLFNSRRKTGNGTMAVKCIIFGVLSLSASLRGFAQADIHFSQFYETSILRNPALTGVFENDYKFGLYYRSQWSSISHPYITALVSAEYRTAVGHSSDYVSFGLLGYTDQAGSIDQRITGIYPAINYNKCLNTYHNTYLSAGFTGGYLQYSFDPSKATFDNQFINGHFSASNPTYENITNAKMQMWDLGAGINFNTSSGEDKKTTYILGVSGYHFTQPEFSYFSIPDNKEYVRWNVNAGISRDITNAVLVTTYVNYAQQNTYYEIMAGSLATWIPKQQGVNPMYTFSAGIFYRYNDAVIPVIKVKYKNMSLGFSYDVNVSSLVPASAMQGAYEITLFISGNTGDRSGVIKKTMCPRFF